MKAVFPTILLPAGGSGQVFARAGSAIATVAASANRVIQRVKREEVIITIIHINDKVIVL
jgi:hypothetical protein